MELLRFCIVFTLVCICFSRPDPEPKIASKGTKNELDPGQNSLLSWDPPFELKRKFPYYLMGFDKDARPVWTVEFGKWDLRSVAEAGGQIRQDFDKYIDQALLRLNMSTSMRSKADKPVKQYSMLADLDGYSMMQFTSFPTTAMLIQLSSKLEPVWRTSFHRIIGVNSNFLVEMLFNIVKPVLGPTGEKIEIYGNNPTRWRPILLKQIPKDQLLTWFGGTATEKDIIYVYG